MNAKSRESNCSNWSAPGSTRCTSRSLERLRYGRPERNDDEGSVTSTSASRDAIESRNFCQRGRNRRGPHSREAACTENESRRANNDSVCSPEGIRTPDLFLERDEV